MGVFVNKRGGSGAPRGTVLALFSDWSATGRLSLLCVASQHVAIKFVAHSRELHCAIINVPWCVTKMLYEDLFVFFFIPQADLAIFISLNVSELAVITVVVQLHEETML